MTNERSTADMEGLRDPQVSATYRDIATEPTPASLNEKVLREASAHAGSGYSYWMLWLRPMAWAATVGLCLAIVVELAHTPGTLDFETPETAAESDIFPVTDAPILDEAAEVASLRAAPKREQPPRPTSISPPGGTEADALADGLLCNARARATPESWLECIETLQREGHDTDEERDALAAAFPDFAMPGNLSE